MRLRATATVNGMKVRGFFITQGYAAFFINEAGDRINWVDITDLDTTVEKKSLGGSSTTEAKRAAARLNGRLGGRPRKVK